MDFEWDPEKEQSNRRKHDVSFFEASPVFGDPMELTIWPPIMITDALDGGENRV